MEYICPAKMKDRVHYIEAVLFATGTEFAITTDMLDLDGKTEEEIEEMKRIAESKLSEVEIAFEELLKYFNEEKSIFN